MEIDETAFGGVDLTDSLGHGGINRRSSAAKQLGQTRLGWLARARERDHSWVLGSGAAAGAANGLVQRYSGSIEGQFRHVGRGPGSAEPLESVDWLSPEEPEDRLGEDEFGAARRGSFDDRIGALSVSDPSITMVGSYESRALRPRGKILLGYRSRFLFGRPFRLISIACPGVSGSKRVGDSFSI